MTRQRLIIISIFLLALALRMFLIPNRGFEADIAFWKSWGLAVYDHNAIWSFLNTNNNYPTPFAYLLGFLVKFYSIFADPHNFNQYWSNANVLFLLVSKLPAILADLGIAVIILWIGSASGRTKRLDFPILPTNFYFLLTILYLLNPVSLIDGALWGQVDALGVFLFLLACLSAFSKKPVLAGAVFMLSMMTKLQNMIYGPLFFLLLWQLGGFESLVKAIAGALITFLGLNVEFLLAKKMDLVIASIINNYDYFPFLSLNAYNPWWIVSGGRGMQVSDKILSLGIINAKTLGMILFSTGYLLAILTMLSKNYFGNITGDGRWGTPTKGSPRGFSWGKTPGRTRLLIMKNEGIGQEGRVIEPILLHFFTALIIVCFSFFLFQTESHDRYAFPISVFLLFWGMFYVYTTSTERMRIQWWKTRSFYIFLLIYITFSLLFSLNLHTALIVNYPNNGLTLLSFLQNQPWTITLSVGMTLLFFLFLFTNRDIVGVKNMFISLLFSGVCILTLNLPLLTKSPISLTRLIPYVQRQDYGVMTVDMPINAAGPSKNWTRLSVQYSFYKTGIGTHAKSYIVYDLAKQFSRFTTDMGIDTEAGKDGSVIFKIYGDDKLLLESPLIKRYEYPRHADVDVTGINTLSLVVEDGGNGITDDHADWLNPQLFP